MKIINIDPGRVVVCDNCNADYTDSNEQGGMLWEGRAVCPRCEQHLIRNATSYAAFERSASGHCPVYMSFADWVRSLRAAPPSEPTP